MNLRDLNTSETSDTSDNVEELRRQIESALGSVEEIVKNKAVISVATEPEQPTAGQPSEQDEVVVYVSIKINKNKERERDVESQHHNGDAASNNGVNGGSSASNGEAEAEMAGRRRRKVRTEDCEVTGQAIQPRRRGRGPGSLGRSSTAPSTPVRTRAVNLRTNNSLEQTKSLEVRQSDSQTAQYQSQISTNYLHRKSI